MALLGQVVFPFRSPRLIPEFETAWIASVGWMDCPPVSPGGGSEVPEALLEPGVGAGLTWSPWCRWAAHRERARGGAKPGGAGRESGRGGDGGRSQLCSGDPHCGWEGTGSMAGAGPILFPGLPTGGGRDRGRWQGGGGRGGGGPGGGGGEGFPVVLSGVAVAAGSAHCVCSWVPKGRHPVGAAEGCGPQVRELGLRGAGNHVVRPLLAQPGGRRKASPLGSRP